MEGTSRIFSLNGDWQFTYSRFEPDLSKSVPSPEAYSAWMSVPGYWDDHTDKLENAGFWSRGVRLNPEYRKITFPMGSGKPADASLPYILGTGWYKKEFVAEPDWKERMVILHVGGVALEAWVWLNGQFIGHHIGHLTPFEMRLDEWLKPAESNELVIAVANTRTDRIGCSIRGFKGKSAGIYRSVELKVAGYSRIRDCYLQSNNARQQISWEIETESKQPGEQLELDWELRDPRTNLVLATGTQKAKPGILKWTTETFGMREWSDRQPALYRIQLILRNGEHILDRHEQMFGLRSIEANGIKLRLNGHPVMLRGLTDHAYFPETCTPPTDIHFYRTTIKKLRQLGFNWIRFHTWTPPEECLQAADELGMMLQVEAPNGFAEADWLDILRTCRKHPSVIIYCCGNEVALDEEMLSRLKQMAQYVRQVVPDALFNPMEGLHSVEYAVSETDEGYVAEPFPHNAKRLAQLKQDADVFAPHGALFSYHSLGTDDAKMEQRLEIFERPCLIHEAGINDSYLNLDLEHRYEGTRIGMDLYAAARSNIEKMGLLHMAAVYYHNSNRWMQQIVKYSLENARRCEYVAGYDLLGAIDCHWHRSGYAVGLLNEFYEMKPGATTESVLNYNGESVLLANCGKHRNVASGGHLKLEILASLYGRESLQAGSLTWVLRDEERTVYASGEQAVQFVAAGKVEAIGDICVTAPDLIVPRKMMLEVCLTGGAYHVKNIWDYWVFPAVVQSDDELRSTTRIMSCLDAESLSFIAGGGKALLLGSGPFPSLPTTFQIMSGGRTQGNNATVIHDHPLTTELPHEGFCDWQFYTMLEGAETVVFNDLGIPFEPIVEVVSSYKLIRKQSSLFELQVGAGRLLVCTLNFNEGDCGAQYLYQRLLVYMDSPSFQPTTLITPEKLQAIMQESQQLDVDFSTDEGYDNGGHVQKMGD